MKKKKKKKKKLFLEGQAEEEAQISTGLCHVDRQVSETPIPALESIGCRRVEAESRRGATRGERRGGVGHAARGAVGSPAWGSRGRVHLLGGARPRGSLGVSPGDTRDERSRETEAPMGARGRMLLTSGVVLVVEICERHVSVTAGSWLDGKCGK